MLNEKFNFQGHSVTVTAVPNESGDWRSDIAMIRGAIPVSLQGIPMYSPTWLTPEEAVRAGVEEARRLIDRYLSGHDDLHTIKDRAGE
jgi:hypothetical protein